MGEIALLLVGFRTAEETLAPRNPARRPFERDSLSLESSPGHLLLFLGDAAPDHQQRCPSRSLSHPLPGRARFSLCIYRCC